MPKITITGLDALQKKLKSNVRMDDVKRVVKHNGSGLQRTMQSKADFTQGYQTGTTKRSIGLALNDGGLTAEVEPGTSYSPYVNFGTRFMDAQPFVTDAFNEQKEKFKSDMQKLVR